MLYYFTTRTLTCFAALLGLSNYCTAPARTFVLRPGVCRHCFFCRRRFFFGCSLASALSFDKILTKQTHRWDEGPRVESRTTKQGKKKRLKKRLQKMTLLPGTPLLPFFYIYIYIKGSTRQHRPSLVFRNIYIYILIYMYIRWGEKIKLPASIARLWCSVENSDDNRFLNYFFLGEIPGEILVLVIPRILK
jgi:hypothetical protein